MADGGFRVHSARRPAAGDREARWVVVGRAPPAGDHRYGPVAMMGIHDTVASMGSGGGGGAAQHGSEQRGPAGAVGFIQLGESPSTAPRARNAEDAMQQHMQRRQQLLLRHQSSYFSSSYLWEVHLGSYRELCHQGKEFQK